MIVVMAGLPGTGKSTLARELAARTSGVVLDKDRIRRVLFPPADIEYSTEQNDFCMGVLFETAGYLLRKDPQRFVFLDGRPFSKRSQVQEVLDLAATLQQPWRLLECVCSEEEVRTRLVKQAGEHPAADRDYSLYLRVKASWETITVSKTVIDTCRPLESAVQQALHVLCGGV